MGEGKHTDSTFGECFETLVQGCAAGAKEPPAPLPRWERGEPMLATCRCLRPVRRRFTIICNPQWRIEHEEKLG